MNQVVIDKIRLKIGDKEVELTLDQAKDLKKVLNDLWPETTITITPQPYREIPDGNAQWPNAPVYPTTPVYPWWTQPLVTWCEGSGNVLCVATK